MKTRFVFLAVVGLLLLALSACGSTDGLSGRAGMLYFYADT